MPKRLFVDIHKCTGCDLCVDSCSGQQTGSFSTGASNILIQRNESAGIFSPIYCLQCEEHLCVESCPEEAIVYDDTMSIYKVDRELCTSCGICQEVCAYLGIFVDEATVRKCDLCEGDPACVKLCFPGALSFREADFTEIRSYVDKRGAEIVAIGNKAND